MAWIRGTDFDDELAFDGGQQNTVQGYGGNDVITCATDTNQEPQELYGGQGNDYLSVGNTAGSPWWTGHRSNTLDGGVGRDTMVGGNFDETFHVNNVGDVVLDSTQGDSDFVYVHGLAFYVLPAAIERGGIWDTQAAPLDVTLQGNRLDNVLQGGNGATLLRGLRGDDFLITGSGRTTLDGGLGSDHLWLAGVRGVFDYDNVLDSSKEFGMDVLRIADDGRNYKIDLSDIDADPGTDADDPFVFIGNAAFGADATGQVRFEVLSTNRVVVLVSTDADPRAEMRMTLTGSTATPAADNFIL